MERSFIKVNSEKYPYTMDVLLDEYSNVNSVYICDSIGGIRDILTASKSVSKKEKAVLLELVEQCQSHANRMENGLIEKIAILKDEGFVKCSNCRSYTRIREDYNNNLIFECCGSFYNNY